MFCTNFFKYHDHSNVESFVFSRYNQIFQIKNNETVIIENNSELNEQFKTTENILIKKESSLDNLKTIPIIYENIGKDRINGLKWSELIKKYQTNADFISKALKAYKLTNPGVIYPNR